MAGRQLLTAAVVVFAAASLQAQLPGKPAPAFTLKMLEGDTVRLAEYRGRPVLINFWATWCRRCRGEMPLLIGAHQAHEQEGLAILAIDLTDQERSLKDVRKFLAEFQVPFPVLLDEKGKTRKLYALRGVPTSVFVGSDGVVRAVNQGPIEPDVLQRHLTEILPGR
jgi:peroxiredoxin